MRRNKDMSSTERQRLENSLVVAEREVEDVAADNEVVTTEVSEHAWQVSRAIEMCEGCGYPPDVTLLHARDAVDRRCAAVRCERDAIETARDGIGRLREQIERRTREECQECEGSDERGGKDEESNDMDSVCHMCPQHVRNQDVAARTAHQQWARRRIGWATLDCWHRQPPTRRPQPARSPRAGAPQAQPPAAAAWPPAVTTTQQALWRGGRAD